MTTSSAAVRPAPEVAQRLHEEPIVWVTTVRPDGRPHVVPTWFWWDGSAFLLFSKPHAVKVSNVAAHPAVMLALGDPAADFDVLLVEGEADVLAEPTEALLSEELLGKYADWLEAIGLGPEEYAATYSQPVRVVPTRFLPWHGRTARGSVPSSATLGATRAALPRDLSPSRGASSRRPSSARDAARPDRPRRRAATSTGARRAVRYVRRPASASSSVHAPWRPTADGSAPRSRDAGHVKHTSPRSLRTEP